MFLSHIYLSPTVQIIKIQESYSNLVVIAVLLLLLFAQRNVD